MSARPTVSIVICCYTDARWSDLRAAVESACAQSPAPDEVIVVVDHNPALQARAALAFAQSEPVATRIVENSGARGLSSARNAGILASNGEIVAFLDDDAEAAPGMLAALLGAMAEPDVLGVTAEIRPDWRGAPPRWYPDEFLWAVGCSYRGLTPGRVRNLIGAAMAIRRSVFEAVGGFDAQLGRGDGPLPLGCEETELCLRAARHFPRGRFLFEPAARCDHKVGSERRSLSYLLSRCYAEGLSKAKLARLLPSGSALAAERAYTLRVLPRAVGRGLRDAAGGDIGGLARAGAVCASFAATLGGYAIGRARLALSAASGVPARTADEPGAAR